MNQQANVLSIDALADFKGALNRFRSDGEAALVQAEQEIRRSLDWLHERVNHWQNEVRRRAEETRQAQNVLSRCQASGYTDRDGNYHPPDCRKHETALLEAKVRLREAEAELQSTMHWGRMVQQASEEYKAQARGLSQQLNGELPKAAAMLENKIAMLQSYVSMSAPSVTIANSAGESVSLHLDPSALQPLIPPDPSTWKAETLETRWEERQLGQQLSDAQRQFELGRKAHTAGEVLSAGAFGLAPTAEAVGEAVKNLLEFKVPQHTEGEDSIEGGARGPERG